LSLKLNNSRNIKVGKTLKVEQKDQLVVLDVRGLIYYGNFHFTSRFIEIDVIVWYYDGITTKSNCEGDFNKFSSRNLAKCKEKS